LVGLDIVRYTSSELYQLFKAAKATNENLIIQWWAPEPQINDYTRISFPTVTSSCLKSRNLKKSTRCEESFNQSIGNEGSGCDYAYKMTDKYTAQSFIDKSLDTPPILRNPAYYFLDKITMKTVDASEMLDNWISRNVDTSGYDGRDAVCGWVVNNLLNGGENSLLQFIPQGYPRTVTNKSRSSYSIGPVVFGSIITLVILGSMYMIYHFRFLKIISYAEPDVLYLFGLGYLFICISAILYGVNPSNGSCMSREWFFIIGFTLSNIPLLMKASAINNVKEETNAKVRIHVSKKIMYQSIGLTMSTTIVYLLCWTLIDPSILREELVSASDMEEVSVQIYCTTSAFSYVKYAETMFILCAALLVFQSKRSPTTKVHEFDDIRRLIYASFFFVVVRCTVSFLPNNFWADQSIRSMIISILLSLTSLVNMGIYFCPKFFTIYKQREDLASSKDSTISGLYRKLKTDQHIDSKYKCVDCVQRMNLVKTNEE